MVCLPDETGKASRAARLSDEHRADALAAMYQAERQERIHCSTYGRAAQIEPTGQLRLTRQQVADPVAVDVQMQLEDPLQLGMGGDRRRDLDVVMPHSKIMDW